jgi:hypothetical protein
MALDYTHPEFRFRSPREWDQLTTPKPDVLQLYCPETGTLISFAMDEVEQSPSELLPMARAVLDARKTAYVEAAAAEKSGAPVAIEGETIEAHESALAYMITFHGQRQGRNLVGYLGIVTRRKVLHVLVETRVSFVPGRRDMFREVIAGIEPVLP